MQRSNTFCLDIAVLVQNLHKCTTVYAVIAFVVQGLHQANILSRDIVVVVLNLHKRTTVFALCALLLHAVHKANTLSSDIADQSAHFAHMYSRQSVLCISSTNTACRQCTLFGRCSRSSQFIHTYFKLCVMYISTALRVQTCTTMHLLKL